MKNLCIAPRVCAAAVVCLCAATSQAATISVAAGGDLQSALLNAQPGDTITLARGAVYTGNFVLPVKGGAAMIVVRTEGDADLPGAGQRISPADSPRLATIKTPNNTPAIQTAWGAHHWTLMLLEIAGTGGNDVMTLGDGNQTQLSQVAHDLVVDRVYLHGNGFNGPGPFTITNNYLEAAAENIMFGGADPGIPGLVPSDIVISDNFITKPT